RGRQRGQSSKLVADTENRIVLEPQLASIVAILVGDIIASMARLSLMLEIRISSASGSLRIELRVDPSVDRIAVTSVHDDIASSRSAAGVLGEVILGYLEPEHAKGAGLYLDVCSVSHGIPRAHRRPLFDL
ncbi:MAG: hypothetical protein JXM71_02445, partial [Spirochaetales bacterium]|nr:hypothetical protein [Spirochaetales bacterium]